MKSGPAAAGIERQTLNCGAGIITDGSNVAQLEGVALVGTRTVCVRC